MQESFPIYASQSRNAETHSFYRVFGADALRFGDRVASSIHAGAWSLVPGLALAFRSTPAATNRFAAGALSSRWSMLVEGERLE
jgi:hypothetical protein